jgi:DNA-binding GntR family transcriptional regulator
VNEIVAPSLPEPPARPTASEWALEPDVALHNRRALVLMSVRDAEDKPPLARRIFDDVVIDIVEGRLMPGDSVNSVELAKRFGTSRTPVREALGALERQGVVIVPSRRRPYVAPVTLKQVKDVYDLRANLFTLVSELIVETCPKPRIAELWKWQSALEDDLMRDSVEDFFWHSVGFRLLEGALADNDELSRCIGMLGVRTLQFRHLGLTQPGRLRRALDDYRRLLVAYEDGDKMTAVSITRSLIMSGYQTIIGSGYFKGGRMARAQEGTAE